MKFRRIIAAVLLCVLLLGVAPAGAVQTGFQDVPIDEWYASYVRELSDRGLMIGVSETQFCPWAGMTREMVITVLYRLAEQSGCDMTAPSAPPFQDVAPGAYYAQAVAWGKAQGIVLGLDDGRFGVGRKITREEFCAFVVRFLQEALDWDLTEYEQTPHFKDNAKMSAYAVAPIGIASKMGIVQGRDDGTFDPKGTIMRAEAAAIFCRVLWIDRKVDVSLGDGQTQDTIRVTDGDQELYSWSGSLGDIPVLRLTGDMTGISKENTVLVSASYDGGDTTFDCYATLKWQGNSSVRYEKKNYSVKLFKDAAQDKKNKVDLGWGKESKYCLKANYIDISQSRNIVTAGLWGEVVHSRENCDPNLKALVNGGAVDGYPIMLFVNDEYQGMYTLNMPKDEWIWDSGVEELQGAVVSDIVSEATAFRSTTTLESGQWEVECAADDDAQAVTDSLNKLLAFVVNHNGADFVEGIDQYLDVEAAIDYMLCAYYFNAPDNIVRNMVMLTYDGVRWIPSMYDLDATWGLYWNGRSYYPLDEMLPAVQTGGVLTSGGKSLLWDRLLENYPQQVRARYDALRATVLNEAHVMQAFTEFQAPIPTALFETEPYLWAMEPGATTNNLAQIRSYLLAHEKLLDARMALLPAAAAA